MIVEKFTVRPTEGESVPKYKKQSNEHGLLKYGFRFVASLTIEQNPQSVRLQLPLNALLV